MYVDGQHVRQMFFNFWIRFTALSLDSHKILRLDILNEFQIQLNFLLLLVMHWKVVQKLLSSYLWQHPLLVISIWNLFLVL